MFKQHDIITAIELGTSKFCVLVGETAGDGGINVIGRGESDAENAMLKGEIIDMDLAAERLSEAVDNADDSSGGALNSSDIFVVNVTGCNIGSFQGVGTAFVKNPDFRVGDAEIREAVRNAQIKPLPVEQRQINTFDAFFMLDDARRVTHPLEQVAHKLEAYSHVIHGDANRLENVLSLLRDIGFEDEFNMIFTPMADVYGIMTEAEKESGTLLVDFGAGVTEYAVISNGGVLASGQLAIGFDNVANDLAVGFNLPIKSCRKMFLDGVIENAIISNQSGCECKNNNGALRRLPTESFSKIIDARLRETFDLIRKRLVTETFWRNLGGGGVLTGGGARYFRSLELSREIFDLPMRLGFPADTGGAITNLADPRYSTVWGALKFGEKKLQISESIRPEGLFDSVTRTLAGMGDILTRGVRAVRQTIKQQ